MSYTADTDTVIEGVEAIITSTKVTYDFNAKVQKAASKLSAGGTPVVYTIDGVEGAFNFVTVTSSRGGEQGNAHFVTTVNAQDLDVKAPEGIDGPLTINLMYANHQNDELQPTGVKVVVADASKAGNMYAQEDTICVISKTAASLEGAPQAAPEVG